MKYKLVLKKNPLRPEDDALWYANPVKSGTTTLRGLSNEIAARSSLTAGDVQDVLENFVDTLPMFLKMGQSVQLGDFGTMRLSLSSGGAPTPEEFNARMIKNVRVIFTPSVTLKDAIARTPLEWDKPAEEAE